MSGSNLEMKGSHFDTLPTALVSQCIFSFLTINDSSQLGSTNQLYRTLANENNRWKKRIEKHFPIQYENLSVQENCDYRAKFFEIYYREYRSLTYRERELLTLAKDEDFETLKTKIKSLGDLADCFDHHMVLRYIQRAQGEKGQAMLDYIYQHWVIPLYTQGNRISTTKVDTGRTILYWAMMCRQSVEVFNSLLEQGSRIDERYPGIDGKFPVHVAAQNGALGILRVLLEINPALLNQEDDNGETPLLWAAFAGHLPVVNYLCAEPNIDLKAVTKRGSHVGATALIWAANGGSLPVVQALIKINPDFLNQTDANDETPLIWAAYKGHLSVVNFLCAQPNINLNAVAKNHGYSALMWAIELGYDAVALALIAKGVDLQIRTTNGNQAIHLAAHYGRLAVVQALIEKDRSLLNSRSARLGTPLIAASTKGSSSVVAYLCKQPHIELDVLGNDGRPALICALEHSHVERAQVLVDAGADLRVVGYKSMGPLHLTALTGNLALFQTLVQKDPTLLDQKDDEGCTALHLAASHERICIIDEIVKQRPELLGELNRFGKSPFEKVHSLVVRRALLKKIEVIKKIETLANFLGSNIHSISECGKLEEVRFYARYLLLDQAREVAQKEGSDKAVKFLKEWNQHPLFSQHRNAWWEGGIGRTHAQLVIDEEIEFFSNHRPR